jgi:hypothetical protein
MTQPFRYQRVTGYDPLSPSWHVTDKSTNTYIGMIKGTAANNFEVKRDQDQNFHSSFGLRREAAHWLKEQSSDPAIFDEDEGAEES